MRMRLRIAVVVTLCAAGAIVSATQTPRAPVTEPGTGAISGVVVDGATARPIVGAVVHLGRGGRGQVAATGRQITDSQGRFVFTDLPAAADLTLSASRAGYFDGGFSRSSTPGTADLQFALTDGQWLQDVRIQLWKPAVIEGVIRDERSEPVAGVEVRTVALVRMGGRDHLAAGPFGTTDDRGRYRIANIPPGRYLVAVPSVQAAISPWKTDADLHNVPEAAFATLQASRNRPSPVPVLETDTEVRVALGPYPIPPPPVDGLRQGYPLTFFPGTPNPEQATPMAVDFGETIQSVDISLAPMPTGRFRGRVEGAGQIANLLVRLMRTGTEELGFGFETAVARTAIDGAFQFANIPTGSYVLEVPVRTSEFQMRSAPVMSSMAGASRPPGLGNFNGFLGTATGGPPGLTLDTFTSGTATFGGGAPSVTTDNSTALWARMPLEVGAGLVPDVVVTLHESATVGGRVRIGSSPPSPGPAPVGFALIVEPADGSPTRAGARGSSDRNDPQRPFAISGLLPGEYLIRVSTPRGWMIESVVHAGRDYTNLPLVLTGGERMDDVLVTVTRNAATISGTVTGSRGAGAAGVQVAAFPTDRAQWLDFGFSAPRFLAATTSRSGGFQISPLPAGEYFVAIVPDARSADWRDPAFFAEAAATAPRVTVDWGQSRTQALRVDRP